ncbi:MULTISPECIES: protein phosphatase 2C domain-containing protein [Streptomyces]|uniref:Protein phosphatase 2C domain-containing protein n=1 Tax=Streptomyces solicathayae TaxID=3081768 RepID=A0ABZ0LPJ4_9ACTN|nr:protein phosphatase 2C domain-containing protein [Streptomyces sp. HUAS YS2]WOX21361.1 protein phosphatase 2C domain-containing protein [Streptomyces sp. HUAS YS2]
MTQQGDNWWDKLYDDAAPDTAPTRSGDTLDDRFDSATRATGGDAESPPPQAPTPPQAAPPPRAAPPPVPQAPPPPVPPSPPQAAPLGRAPWEAPADGPAAPRTFPSRPPEPPPAPPAPPVPPLPDVPPATVTAGPAPETETETDPDTEPESPPSAVPRPRTGHIGDRPPTYEPEPTALPAARPGELADLVADTVLDGARYGACTLRAASVRGDSARYRGEPRRDALLTARFGHDEAALVLVAVAAGARAAEDAHLAAADACRWIGEAVGRSHARLSEDIRAGRRGDLKSGLHRLTDRTYGRLRGRAAERGLAPGEYTATLRCLLLSADPECRTRVFFGIGRGGLFRLRDGAWQDIEPLIPEPAATVGAPVVGFGSTRDAEPDEAYGLTMDLGITTAPGPFVEAPLPPPAEPFRFRASVARPGDTLLLASTGLADPLRGEPALAAELAARWAGHQPPGLAAFLADTQLRVKGYADDRTGVAVWET